MPGSRMWCFTIHGEQGELEELIEAIAAPRWGVYGMVQMEQCPETGRLHLQGFLVLPKQQRLSFVKKIHSTAHWEPAHGSLEHNEAYCSKVSTRVVGTATKTWGDRPTNVGQGKRTDIDEACALVLSSGGTIKQRMKRVAEQYPTAVAKFHRGLEMVARLTEKPVAVEPPAVWYKWQSDLLEYLESDAAKADNRAIVWITDPVGNQGKSTIVRYLVANHDALYINGKVSDMAHAYNGEPIVLFDITRTQLENMDHLYSFAEMLKNGLIFSPKYDSGMKVFSSPRVVFFANQTYARGKWTEDRVHEWQISGDQNGNNFSAVSQTFSIPEEDVGRF